MRGAGPAAPLVDLGGAVGDRRRRCGRGRRTAAGTRPGGPGPGAGSTL